MDELGIEQSLITQNPLIETRLARVLLCSRRCYTWGQGGCRWGEVL
jgi:hypothetical protein